MADVHTPEIRSKNMRAVRSGNTRPELIVRKGLHAAGFRFRLHGAALRGKPDIVLPKYRTVIFVHGCFWHQHDCRYFKVPRTRPEFWIAKIGANRERDRRDTATLTASGWHVIVIWECAVRAGSAGAADTIRRTSLRLAENKATATPAFTTITP